MVGGARNSAKVVDRIVNLRKDALSAYAVDQVETLSTDASILAIVIRLIDLTSHSAFLYRLIVNLL